mmetsp:Transcript_1081/g.2510  ORF Transcript_1081/g.2510 Transcript_1081/m.2510 type:complete len:284 (-) Transcript_1081:803-1654(-)
MFLTALASIIRSPFSTASRALVASTIMAELLLLRRTSAGTSKVGEEAAASTLSPAESKVRLPMDLVMALPPDLWESMLSDLSSFVAGLRVLTFCSMSRARLPLLPLGRRAKAVPLDAIVVEESAPTTSPPSAQCPASATSLSGPSNFWSSAEKVLWISLRIAFCCLTQSCHSSKKWASVRRMSPCSSFGTMCSSLMMRRWFPAIFCIISCCISTRSSLMAGAWVRIVCISIDLGIISVITTYTKSPTLIVSLLSLVTSLSLCPPIPPIIPSDASAALGAPIPV